MMTKLSVLLVNNIEDLRQCLYIREEVFQKGQNVAKELEVDELDCICVNCEHFLIQYEDKSIGTLRCIIKDEKTVQLQRFCFLSEYRSMGFGRHILGVVENYYRNNGKEKIKMDAQLEVYKFYEKCGYQVVSDVFVKAEIEHVKMDKQLK